LLNRVAQYHTEQAWAELICPYTVSDKDARLFTKYGVPFAKITDKPHNHAFNRAAANQVLYQYFAKNLSEPCTLLQIKAGKAQHVADISKQPVFLANQALTARDHLRFADPQGWPTVVSTPSVLLDETAHHMSLIEFGSMLEAYPDVNTWYLTLNIPCEVFDRSASIHDHYELSYEGDHFRMALNGDFSDSYSQPLSSTDYLTTSSLTVNGQIWTFERCNSVASNHLVVVRRGRFITPSVDALESDYVVTIPTFGRELPVKWINGQVYTQLLMHARSLKSHEMRDAFSKLRTYVREQGPKLPLPVLDHLSAVIWKVANLDISQAALPPQLQSLRYRLAAWLRRFFTRLCPWLGRLIFGVDQILLDTPSLYQSAPHRFQFARVPRVVTSPPVTFLSPAPATPLLPKTADSALPPGLSKTTATTSKWLADMAREARHLPPPAKMTSREEIVEATHETAARAQAGPSKIVPPPNAQPADDLHPASVSSGRSRTSTVRAGARAGPFLPAVPQYILEVRDAGTRHAPIPLPPRDAPGICLIYAIAGSCGLTPEQVWDAALESCDVRMIRQALEPAGMSVAAAHRIATQLSLALNIIVLRGSAQTAFIRGMPNFVGALEGRCFALEFVVGAAGQLNHWQSSTVARTRGPALQVSANPANPRGGFGPPLPEPACKWTLYQPDFRRAKLCYEAWVKGEWGIVFENLNTPERRDMELLFKAPITRAPVKVHIATGGPGSGKSRFFKDYFRRFAAKLVDRWHVNFSRLALMEEWKDLAPPAVRERSKHCLKTLEKIPTWDIEGLHIEELQQHPPGYLDMRLFLCPSIKFVSATGDCLQNLWAPGRKHTPLTSAQNELHRFMPMSGAYRLTSHRLCQSVAHVLGLDTSSGEVGFIRLAQNRRSNMWTLDARTRFAEADLAFSAKTLTMSSCTGIDWDHEYQIILDHTALHDVPAETIFTALSRSSKGVWLVWEGGKRMDDLRSHPIWGPASRGETISWNYFQQLPTTAWMDGLNLEIRGGGQAQKFESLGPQLRAVWSYSQRVMEQQIEDREPCTPMISPRTHFAPASAILGARWFEVMNSKESSEYPFGLQTSDQVRDELKGNLAVNSLFAKQDHKDDVGLTSAVTKRMRFKSAAQNRAHHQKRVHEGSLLFGRFLETFDLPLDPQELDPDELARHAEAVIDKKLTRPTAQLQAYDDRASPDTPENSAKIFLKSQEKAKRSTILNAVLVEGFEPWWNDPDTAHVKPGQTLALFPDQVLQKLGPVTRYVAAWAARHLPSWAFIFGGQTPLQLDAWSKRFGVSGKVFTNDFTAYDQSCTGEALEFEMRLLRHLGFDEDIVQYYYWLKTTLVTTFGPSAVMRFTGEPGTYIFNTLYNMAYMSLKYDIHGIPGAWSGDDSLLMRKPVLNPQWPLVEKSFTLVSKEFYTDVPEFCGWLLTPIGAIRDPLTLVLKTVYKQNRGELHEVLDNYFLEAMHAYGHGDLLHDVLCAEQLENHTWFMNFAFSHSSLVRHLSLTRRDELTADLSARFLSESRPQQQFQWSRLLSSLPYVFGIWDHFAATSI
jgi:hypothetical protein